MRLNKNQYKITLTENELKTIIESFINEKYDKTFKISVLTHRTVNTNNGVNLYSYTYICDTSHPNGLSIIAEEI